MTILNGFSNKIARKLRNLCIHSYKWTNCSTSEELNRKLSIPGIKIDRPSIDNDWWYSVFIVYWVRRYIVISWRGGKCRGVNYNSI